MATQPANVRISELLMHGVSPQILADWVERVANGDDFVKAFEWVAEKHQYRYTRAESVVASLMRDEAIRVRLEEAFLLRGDTERVKLLLLWGAVLGLEAGLVATTNVARDNAYLALDLWNALAKKPVPPKQQAKEKPPKEPAPKKETSAEQEAIKKARERRATLVAKLERRSAPALGRSIEDLIAEEAQESDDEEVT